AVKKNIIYRSLTVSLLIDKCYSNEGLNISRSNLTYGAGIIRS
ncbi:hypothetical protein SM73_02159, partial [Klebsiella quasipneumoniae]